MFALMLTRAARITWLVIGILSLGLGALGILLPLLPTTPLVLLAAFSFARSSDRLHQWLLEHDVFGALIENWRQYGAISRRAKIVSVISMAAILVLSLVYKGLKNLKLDLPFLEALGIGVGVGLLAAIIAWLLMRRLSIPADATIRDHLRVVERAFVYLQVMTACFVAFAHGSNDVANAIGPLAAVITVAQTGAIASKSALPTWVLMLGGGGIVIGLATYGRHVIATVGRKITQLTPSRGFAAELAAATTIVIASGTGIPISTTHTLVGAVLGVGMARGIEAIDLRVVGRILVSWVVTIPAGAFLAILFFYLVRAVLP